MCQTERRIFWFPLLRVDPILIERVFVNLLENAGKYTPVGSRISIVATFNSREARVIVQDNGPGFPLLDGDSNNSKLFSEALQHMGFLALVWGWRYVNPC